jgi:hypothetical protein
MQDEMCKIQENGGQELQLQARQLETVALKGGRDSLDTRKTNKENKLRGLSP